MEPLHAKRATTLYAFCRMIDDIADHASSADDALKNLTDIQQQIKTLIITDKRLEGMSNLMRECKIDPAVVNELIEGVASDLTHTPFCDYDVLLRYCYRVAGAVGLMMCRVLDVDSRLADYHAIDLGIGMQLTNICRDISEDAAIGRRYMPATSIGDIPPQQLIDPSPELRPIVTHGVKQLLELADRYCKSGEEGLPFLPSRARLSICVASRVYWSIGKILRERNYAYWHGRARVGVATKSTITLHALASSLIQPEFWRLPKDHDPFLHAALQGLPYVNTARLHDRPI